MNACPICSGRTKSWSHHFCIAYVYKKLARWWTKEGFKKPQVYSDFRGEHDVNYNELECAKIKLKNVDDPRDAKTWSEEAKELWRKAGNPAPRPEWFVKE